MPQVETGELFFVGSVLACLIASIVTVRFWLWVKSESGTGDEECRH